ncbi:MAG: SpoIID/LytB domain-containing protein [Prevotella sp.]|nr:SpoIID/LytB domain-containing protein [Prevotella sp.]
MQAKQWYDGARVLKSAPCVTLVKTSFRVEGGTLKDNNMQLDKQSYHQQRQADGHGLTDGVEPRVTVGIVSGKRIAFSLNAPYESCGHKVEGEQVVEYADGQVLWNGERHAELCFQSADDHASFSLRDVTIGVNFHWERKETQTFSGQLRIVVDGDKVCAINELPVEDYLKSVISSEMSGDSSLELLKAHAVISRSWLLAQMRRRQAPKAGKPQSTVRTDDTLIRWYDQDDHTLFDVCADDHCQRYQGITRETNPRVAEAIRETRGKLLMADGDICDARFSKCCGGVTEEYQYCWENSPKRYLSTIADTPTPHDYPDLTVEQSAEKWIRSNPESFCNTTDRRILAQVLNGYDQETTDFYRWHVTYTQAQLSELIARKLGIDFGGIVDLIPMERGRSGRLSLLKIVGTRKIMAIGKELEIRRALSESHLYSSAFVVDKQGTTDDGLPATFDIVGAGWGHGVGLCQIGAAVMGEKGYAYDTILLHYYPGAEIVNLYE